LQVGGKNGGRAEGGVQGSQGLAGNRPRFSTRLLPGGGDAEVPTELLSVREAAKHLGMCTATVYRLCRDSALPHVRILNAIRIVPADLREFVAARRTAIGRVSSEESPPGHGILR
jgi:excisionase family DNA binding protein